ncbi:tRNA modification GTPase [Tepidamorphus gemmatus]|uniref:tRNA modification GTPase MnmE n=1 Tax=Tepidamorphus gemmatus TaxID=747076 RepID=A0A4R3MDQ0_9HYPH|nr:tRNA uridine-5-carboxymethylaminomethyl(34) synthesis GTPase MnmE [Tepidamorphus gemmatus]TCT11894.1 tRNA modification GTPase [Tepidamorphus gemmatus]
MDRAQWDCESETIFALSSAVGRAGVAVIRISGPRAGRALAALSGAVPEPRRAVLRRLRDASGALLDQALVVWMPGPASFTGEDIAELHVHGGRAVVAGVLAALSAVPGLRPAEAGEFARRAFGNGRLDLTAVEGLADLIDAETEAQRRQALRQLEGETGAAFEALRGRVIEALALAEAGIDFADEDDVPASIGFELAGSLADLGARLRGTLADDRRGEMLRAGVEIVIAGPPNAGKSSLMNWLARREVAIVSEIPGTTRDALEVRLELAGVPVTVVDTAGVRETRDAVEAEGVRRARARAERADLVLWLEETGIGDGETARGRTVTERSGYWRVRTKADLAVAPPPPGELAISVVTGEGLEVLLARLEAWVAERVGSGSDTLITRLRHRTELQRALEAVERAAAADYARDPELVAEDLRAAATAIGRIVGRVDVEDVLDAIFAGFCIGK